MGKVIKLSENKFKRLFESEDDGVDEFTKYDDFERYITTWAKESGFDIEKDGWFYKLYVGSNGQCTIIVDFDNETEPQRAFVFKMEMSCDNFEENFEILKEYQKVLYALDVFNKKIS